MSHKKNRSLKFLQGLGYVVLTGVAAVGTVFLATVTVGLAMTGIGIPLAFVTGAATVGCAAGTGYFAFEAGHKFVHAFESDDYDHHHYVTNVEIKPVSAYFDKKQINEIETQLKNQADITGSSKPLFVPTSTAIASNAPVLETVASVKEEDETVAKQPALS